MSYNLYQGAELTPIVEAQSLQDIPAAVSQVWTAVQATDWPTRAHAIAHEIAAAHPDLVGLQEAALWRIQTPGTAFSGHPVRATKVVYDFIADLVGDLGQLGLHYSAAAVSPSFDGQLPDAQGDDIRLTDRVAILVRTDLPPGELRVVGAGHHKFAVNATVNLGGAGGAPFTIYNSWAYVDVVKNGQAMRFVTAHVDGNSPLVNDAEAAELLAGPAHTNRSVVVSGDFNSPPDGSWSASYAEFTQAGFQDAWLQTHDAGQPGYTWGQAEDLRNATSTMSERIDYAFLHGDVQAVAMQVVGADPADKTADGLWPSDHAGIVTTVEVQNFHAHA
jgi:endonuclease/exonuclease/phosphatase family metal-dependent hydrolase